MLKGHLKMENKSMDINEIKFQRKIWAFSEYNLRRRV